MRRAIFCAAVLLAACDDTVDPPPPTDAGKDTSSSADGTVDTGVDGGPDATVDGDTDATSDAADDASDAGADGGDGGPVGPAPICDPSKGWAAGVKLAPSTLAVDARSTVNGTETTLAWITPGDGAVHYVDRVDSTVAWDPERTLPATGLAPGQRVALTRDGYFLYGIGTDLRSLVAFTRTSLADPFVGPTADPTLADLNVEGAALAIGETFSDLVVGTSHNALVLRRVGGSSPGLRIATRLFPTDPWTATTAFAQQAELAVVANQARRPTGLSTDARALFYFDEVNGHQMVGFFDFNAATATQFVDLGVRVGAQPNDDCTVLYYTATDDLYSALKN